MSFGWAVIGSGLIADRVFSEITEGGRHRLVSVWSRTFSRAEAFAKKFGGTACGTLEEALGLPGVDGVYVATPHTSHFEHSRAALLAGKPVLCEKPATLNLPQLEELIALAREKNSYFCEGMWTRFNPVTVAVRKAAESGSIGKVKEVVTNFCYAHKLSRFTDRVIKPEYGGGALLDLGVYCAAYSVMLLGKPDSVQARAKLSGGVDIFTEVTLNYDGAVSRYTCALDRFSRCAAHIEVGEGSIRVPLFFKPERAVIRGREGKKTLTCRRGFIYQFDRAAEDIGKGLLESPEMTHEQSLTVMGILDECRRQIGLKYPGE